MADCENNATGCIMVRFMQILFPPIRWIRAILFLVIGVRVHPSALLLGKKWQIVCEQGVKIGAGVRIDPGLHGKVAVETGVWISTDVEMQTESQITVRAGTSIQRRSSINGSVVIGRGCILAPNVFISSGSHPFEEMPHLPIRMQEQRLSQQHSSPNGLDRPVWIQDDCWLGTNTVISPGVTLGKGSVVGANSVVTKNTLPYSVVAGCPAKLIRQRFNWNPKTSIDVSREEDHPYLLSAKLERTTKNWVALLSENEGIFAALQTLSRPYSVYFEWTSTVPFFWILACGRTYQEAGTDHLIVPSSEFTEVNRITYCNLEIQNATNEPASIKISRIYVK